MPIAGTLYDETIKNGYAKLLSVNRLVNAASVTLTLDAAHDNFIINMDNIYCSDVAGVPYAWFSFDNGATWHNFYYWSASVLYQTYATTWGQHVSSVHGDSWIRLALNSAGGHPLSGRLRLFAGRQGFGDIAHLLWKIGSSGEYPFIQIGCGFPGLGNRPTHVVFYWSPGNISGTVQMYGMKKGV